MPTEPDTAAAERGPERCEMATGSWRCHNRASTACARGHHVCGLHLRGPRCYVCEGHPQPPNDALARAFVGAAPMTGAQDEREPPTRKPCSRFLDTIAAQAAVIAGVRALPERWRTRGEHDTYDLAATRGDCADDLDRALASPGAEGETR